MISTFICQHCGRKCRCNPRVKNQNYCSREECQQARKRVWDKKHYHTNKKYREKRLASQKIWRENHPQKQYQQEYRARHPEYVAHCYEKQNERYKTRRKAEREALEKNNVNTDAIFTQPKRVGVYKLIPVDDMKNNVNTDAFIVKMQILSG
jgi:hypothetical protein